LGSAASKDIPEMKPVKSSNVDSVGYKPGSRELYVRFKGGKSYVYSEVPGNIYVELVGAPSVGKYLNKEVIPYFKCERIQ